MRYENDLPQERFLFGASFPPYALGEDWPMEEWEADFRQMKKLSFNTIRVFAAWSRIEPVRGRYDFEKLDYLFDLAEKYDIGVILNFGGLFSSLCGVGKPWYLRGLTPWCRDNPVLRERAFLFMAKTVARYAPRRSLLMWMTWNEPDNNTVCTCEYTAAKFQKWLRERYGDDIEALNRTWGGCSPVLFTGFEEVCGAAGENIAARMDYARFRQWTLAEDLREISELALKLDPQHRPTTANLVYHRTVQEGPSGILDCGQNTALDGAAMTLMGVSCYSTEHYYDPLPQDTVSFKLSRLRGASRDISRRMITLETGAGPNIREHTPESRNCLLWQQIGQNVKGLLAWNYRSRVDGGQVGLFHLMAFDGTPTKRAGALAELSRTLQCHAPLLNRVAPKNSAAVLTLEDTLTLLAVNYSESVHAPLQLHRVQDSRFGAYRLLYDRSIGADCLCETSLEDLGDYRLLLLPAQEQMTKELAESIRSFVAGGGTVIAEAPFAFRSGNGRLQYRFPAFGLDEVFGGSANDRHRDAGAKFRWEGGESSAVDFVCSWSPTTAKVLAVWDDGSPAVLENRFGRGRAVVYGTEVFRRLMEDRCDPVTVLLDTQIREAGVAPALRTEGLTPGDDVEIAALYGEDGEAVWILLNHSGEERAFRVTSGCGLCTLEGEAFGGNVCLAPQGVLVLRGTEKR